MEQIFLLLNIRLKALSTKITKHAHRTRYNAAQHRVQSNFVIMTFFIMTSSLLWRSGP